MLKFSQILSLVIASLISVAANAQVQLPITQPNLKVGEVTKWRVIDMWTNAEISTHESKVTQVNDAGIEETIGVRL